MLFSHGEDWQWGLEPGSVGVALAIGGPLGFLGVLGPVALFCHEQSHWGFGGDSHESVGSSDKLEVLTLSVLPTHEHGSLHSLCSVPGGPMKPCSSWRF